MTKRSLLIALVTVIILAIGAKLIISSLDARTAPNTELPGVLPEAMQGVPASEDPIANAIDESESQSLEMKELKGKDFYVAFSVNSAPEPAVVQFFNASKDPINKLMTDDGHTAEIENLTWGNDVTVQLSTPIKQLDNTQFIALVSSEPLPRGEGFISSQTILLMEGDSVREVLGVMIERTFDPEPNSEWPAINYKGELSCNWSTLACELKYTLNKKTDTITYNWDEGQRKFIDKTKRSVELDRTLQH